MVFDKYFIKDKILDIIKYHYKMKHIHKKENNIILGHIIMICENRLTERI